jgi:hypothetical protein
MLASNTVLGYFFQKKTAGYTLFFAAPKERACGNNGVE